MEGRILGLSHGSNNDVNLEEGVQHMDVGWGDVGLIEGGDFNDLELGLVENKSRWASFFGNTYL